MNNLSVLIATALGSLALQPCRALVASASGEIEAKVALESSIEHRLASVLKEVLAAKDVVVIVNADMLSDAERKAVEVLPGVPPKELSAASAPLAVAPTLVRKLTATVLVDKDLKAADQALARQTVERLLGLPSESDAVTIEPTAFRHPQPPDPPSSALAPENRLGWALPAAWLAFAVVALGLLYALFLAPLVRIARELAAAAKQERPALAEAKEAPAASAALPPPPTTALETARPPGAPASESAHFDFVHERDLPALAFLLARDPTSAAIVLNYLSPPLGARFLDQLPAAVRQEAANLMTQTRLLNKHQVQIIEEGLRERLQYLMGGESRLAEILEGANARVQTELLDSLRERDPDAASRLSRRIVMLGDLALLEDADFKFLSRQVTVRSLAAVLAASPELKERVLPRLSGGAAEWLVQEVDLCGALAPEVVEAEQRRVLAALAKAVREGRIQLRKGEGPLAETPALEAPVEALLAEELRPDAPLS